MFIENGYGKTIQLRIEDYLDMTDEEWQEIIASGHGETINDPFIDYTGIKNEKVVPMEDLDDDIIFVELDEDLELDNIDEEYE